MKDDSNQLSSTCSLLTSQKTDLKRSDFLLPQGWPPTKYKWSYGAPITVGFFHPKQTHLLIRPVIFAATKVTP